MIDLDALEARATEAGRNLFPPGGPMVTADDLAAQHILQFRVAREDVPALVAEVRSLRAALQAIASGAWAAPAMRLMAEDVLAGRDGVALATERLESGVFI